VTASVTDGNRAAVPGVRVDFTASGAHSAAGSVDAGDDGRAQFCYTGNNAGNDTIGAAVGSLTASATKDWVTSPPATTTSTSASTSTSSAPTPTTPSTQATPQPTITATCVDRRKFTFKLHHAPGQRVVEVRIFKDGKLIKSVRGRNLKTVTIDAPAQGGFTVRIVSTQASGSKLVSTRRYSGCEKGKPRTRARHHKRKQSKKTR
jgi:hypothetical protein